MSETNDPAATPATQPPTKIVPAFIPADPLPRKYTSIHQPREMQRNDQTREAVRSLQLYVVLLQDRIDRLAARLNTPAPKEKPAKNA